jgi:TetR/AcrR family transcriptional repressor of nem operon
MPRSSRQQVTQNREAIEHASSRLFRERGLNGISVADLMGSAGLTHGGFYGHFPSKDVLAAVACNRAFSESAERWAQKIEASGGDRQAMRDAIAAPYLSTRHRDHPGHGCAGAALANDIAREAPDKPVRQVYVDGIKGMVQNWMRTLDDTVPPAARHERALVELSTMMGAVMLARATEGDPISEQLLDAARAFLTGTPSPPD